MDLRKCRRFVTKETLPRKLQSHGRTILLRQETCGPAPPTPHLSNSRNHQPLSLAAIFSRPRNSESASLFFLYWLLRCSSASTGLDVCSNWLMVVASHGLAANSISGAESSFQRVEHGSRAHGRSCRGRWAGRAWPVMDSRFSRPGPPPALGARARAPRPPSRSRSPVGDQRDALACLGSIF